MAEDAETPKKGRGFWTLCSPIVVLFVALLIFAIVDCEMTGSQVIGMTPEALAIAHLRTIASAQEIYHGRNKKYGASNELLKAHMISKALAEATVPEKAVNGYSFQIALTGDGWSCTAIPVYPGKTATRSFFSDETGVIRWAPCEKEDDLPAGPESPELEPS